MSIELAELFNRSRNGSYSSDSDQEVKTRIAPTIVDSSRTPKEKANLQTVLTEINAKLEHGEDIDLSKYPPLFLVHFRGVHFFTQFTSTEKRREMRQKITKGELKEGVYSPAIYELAGLTLGEAIDTQDKKASMRKAIGTLCEQFETLSTTKAKEANWWGNTKVCDTEIFQHYQRYVNCYNEFRDESKARRHHCYKVLDSTQNPYVSTADGAKHAVLYALGAKAELVQGTLRPGYNEELRPLHPKVGYVQVLLHSLTSINRHKPLPLSTLHASNKIDIKDRLLNERETTQKAAIGGRHIAHRKVIRFPSMNIAYSRNFHSQKYGITTSQAFTAYKKSLLNGAAKSKLVETLAEHYAAQVEAIAQNIVKEKKGFIVYLGLDGTLKSHLPTTLDVRSARNGANSRRIYDAFVENLSHFTTTAEESDSFDELDVDDDIDSQEATPCLNEIAQAHGFYCHDVPRDGNCFYHAVLHQVRVVLDQKQYAENTFEDFKEACRNEILAHKDFYKEFETDEITLEERLAKENEWADHLMIQAMANILEVTIHIYPDDNGPKTTIVPRNPSQATLHLGYEVGLHYQSFVPTDQNQAQPNDVTQQLAKMTIDPKTKKYHVQPQDSGYESEAETKKAAKGQKPKATKGP